MSSSSSSNNNHNIKKEEEQQEEREVQEEDNNNNNNRKNNNNNTTYQRFRQQSTNPLLKSNEFKLITIGSKWKYVVKIIDGVVINNYWDNIFYRKFQMHDYFAEAAFGSQADKKFELKKLWEDPEYIKKYGLDHNNKDKDKKDNQQKQEQEEGRQQ